MNIFFGLAVGLAAGTAVAFFSGAKMGAIGTSLGLTCAGLFLGWQALLVIAPLVAVVQFVRTNLDRLWLVRRLAIPAAWLTGATTVWIVTWENWGAHWPVLG